MREPVLRGVGAVLLAVYIAAMSSPVYAQYRQDTPRFSPVRDLTSGYTSAVIRGLPVLGQAVADEPVVPQSDDADMTAAASGSVSPAGALYRSLVLPGWGQWENGRKGKALFFALAEAVCIGGYLYENARYTSGDYTGPDKDAIKTDRNSFLLYWMIAKVLNIMDAYVDAQFQSYDVSDITPTDLVR